MDKSLVRKIRTEKEREKDRFREGTNELVVGVLQEALIEKNHFEESLNLPEYPRMLPLSAPCPLGCGVGFSRLGIVRVREGERKREEGKGEREGRCRMEVGGTEYYA